MQGNLIDDLREESSFPGLERESSLCLLRDKEEEVHRMEDQNEEKDWKRIQRIRDKLEKNNYLSLYRLLLCLLCH